MALDDVRGGSVTVRAGDGRLKEVSFSGLGDTFLGPLLRTFFSSNSRIGGDELY